MCGVYAHTGKTVHARDLRGAQAVDRLGAVVSNDHDQHSVFQWRLLYHPTINTLDIHKPPVFTAFVFNARFFHPPIRLFYFTPMTSWRDRPRSYACLPHPRRCEKFVKYRLDRARGDVKPAHAGHVHRRARAPAEMPSHNRTVGVGKGNGRSTREWA
jgi:hypothetical protein